VNREYEPAADVAAPDPRRWLALAVMLLAGVMDLIDVTIVNVALPSIQTDLGATAAHIEWIVAGYTLSFAVVLITGGRLGDVFGRRRMFLVGVGGFTLASLMCGVAQSPEVLIAARVVQGGLAALMIPQILSTVQVAFPPDERPKAFGMYGAFIGFATVSGPLIGGLLVGADLFDLDWRPIFLINLPIGLLALAAAAALVKESRAEHPPRLDLTGVGLVTVALLLLVYPLVQGRELDWPSWTFASMAASIPAFGLFVLHQRRRSRGADSPLVPLALFRERGFAGGVLVGLTFFSGVASFFLILTITLQAGLGFSPLHMGATAVPWSIGIALASGVSVNLAPKLGRRLTIVGALVMAAGMAGVLVAFDRAGGGVTSWDLAPGLFACGLGMGMVASVLVNVVLAGVDGRDAGSASGVLNTAFQLGGAIGIAVLGVVFFGMLPEGSAPAAEDFTGAMRDSMWFLVGLYLVSAALMGLLPKRGRD
jgi:EmrB/QacA subfamily drug resistance transporter